MIVKARIKTNPIEQWSVGREYRRRLKKSFDARGIEIPFPHRTLYFGEASPAFRFVQDAEQPGRAGTMDRTPPGVLSEHGARRTAGLRAHAGLPQGSADKRHQRRRLSSS